MQVLDLNMPSSVATLLAEDGLRFNPDACRIGTAFHTLDGSDNEAYPSSSDEESDMYNAGPLPDNLLIGKALAFYNTDESRYIEPRFNGPSAQQTVRVHLVSGPVRRNCAIKNSSLRYKELFSYSREIRYSES